MSKLNATQIYAAARLAGFSPNQSVTMTAVALAESGGNTGAHNSTGEDSVGLWQVNRDAHPKFHQVDLNDPVENARAAFQVSGSGKDISRWTVTHRDKGSRYLKHLPAAEAAAAANDEGWARGNERAPENYHDRQPADPSDAPQGAESDAFNDVSFGSSPSASAGGETKVQEFLKILMDQEGDRYVFGHEVKLDDANPDTFDCSEIIQWASARVGVDMPDGSWIQYNHLAQKDATMTVEEALKTPGALLFKFSGDPSSGGRPSSAHVAISLGNGKTIEARGSKWGVGSWDANDRGWTHAGAIPELGEASGPLDLASEPNQLYFDHDKDGLLTIDELAAGTNPFEARTLGGSDLDYVMKNGFGAEDRTIEFWQQVQAATGTDPSAPVSGASGAGGSSLLDDTEGIDPG